RARQRAVRVIELPPKGDGSALTVVADGTTAVIDGLALPGLEGAVAAHAARLRLVAFIHPPLVQATRLFLAEAWRVSGLEAALLPRFRGIICPSRRTAAAVECYRVSSGRIAVVPPGTAKPPRYSRLRRGAARSLLCVASLVPRKGHCVLVSALTRIRKLDRTLLLIGSLRRDPATARAVRRMILDANLERRITLAGERPPQSVAGAYKAADIFVLPSLHEGYGMACAEAMAHGLPIIATNAG